MIGIETIKEKYRNDFIEAINDIKLLKGKIIHNHEGGFPMLMGGTELYVRLDDLLMVLNPFDKWYTLQKTDNDFIEREKPLIVEFFKYTNLTSAYARTIMYGR